MKHWFFVLVIVSMLFGAVGCSPQQQSNAEAWNTVFFGSEIELQNMPPEYSETILDALNKYIGENCPLRQDYDFDSSGEIYTVCRDYDGQMIEVRGEDIAMFGLTAVSPFTPWPDEIIAIKWAWNAERTIKVIIVIVFAAEAVNTINIAYTRHSRPDHDPRISEVARNRITRVWDDIQLRLSDPNNKTGPILYCAVVTFQNSIQYVRILSSVDGVTGIMGWYGTDGWVGAFNNKDVEGFLNGLPRGALSYDTGRPLQDCLNALGNGVPGSNQYAP
ncbi:MAG: hypothetical protein WC503_06210 [Candidatus Shapirobacteria bacterium]